MLSARIAIVRREERKRIKRREWEEDCSIGLTTRLSLTKSICDKTLLGAKTLWAELAAHDVYTLNIPQHKWYLIVWEISMNFSEWRWWNSFHFDMWQQDKLAHLKTKSANNNHNNLTFVFFCGVYYHIYFNEKKLPKIFKKKYFNEISIN